MWGRDILWNYFATYVWHPAASYHHDWWPWTASIVLSGGLFLYMIAGIVRGKKHGFVAYGVFLAVFLLESPIHTFNAYMPTKLGDGLTNLLEALTRVCSGDGPYGRWLADQIYASSQYHTLPGYILYVVTENLWAVLWSACLVAAICLLFGVRFRGKPDLGSSLPSATAAHQPT